MTTVLDELSAQESLSRSDIERRVADWKQRIDFLYRSIVSSLPNLFSFDQTTHLLMNEEMMKKFGVESTEVPVLNIYQDGDWVAKLILHGLWIIGANGRLDLYIGQTQYIVVDRSDNFSSPDWQIAPAEDRRNLQPLSPDALRKLPEV